MKIVLLAFIMMSSTVLYAQEEEKFTIQFDFDISEANAANRDKLADWIKGHEHVLILRVYGHTDTVGSAAYNQALSERRAAYIYNRLKLAGVNPEKVTVAGFGETQATGNDAADRRVEIIYTKKPVISMLKENVAVAKVGEKLRLPNLNFYNHSDVVLPQSEPVLRDLLQIMKDRPTLRIDIQGHICCQANEVQNISVRRARTVYNYLIDNGIDKSRLSYRGFASTRPLYPLPERNEAERVANRRVEIEILEQ